MSNAEILLSKCFQQEGRKKLNFTGKAATSGRGISWARYNPRIQKKHILARRVIDHWNKLPRMITDFIVS